MFSIKMLMLTEAPRTIINGSYGSNFKAIFDFFYQSLNNWPLSRGYFGSWGHALVAVAVVERFK